MAYGAFTKKRPPEGGLVDGLRRVSERAVESGSFILVNTHSTNTRGMKARDGTTHGRANVQILLSDPLPKIAHQARAHDADLARRRRGIAAAADEARLAGGDHGADAAMSPLRIAASAVSWVPPSGASISTMSADLPEARTPQSSR